MGLTLDQIVPWGRSLDEYIRMFDLSMDDQARNILDCGGGPASFNAEMTQRGASVTSCDPIYKFSKTEIGQRIQQTYPIILQGVQQNRDDYVWTELRSPEHLCKVRLNAMAVFLNDFELGLSQGRYVTAELPQLPFGDRQFDLALCSHLLFTYSTQLSEAFHLSAILELCRVAFEVRIFPILAVSGEPSPYLSPVKASLTAAGYQVEQRTVPYEFQRGGNQMWVIHPLI
jgi:hypothetical protein